MTDTDLPRVEPALDARELRNLILKLRWIGADDQAETLARQLARIAPRDFIVLPPAETD